MASDASLLRAGVEAGLGLSTAPADVLRYDHQSADPAESTGLLIAGIPTGARVLDVGCGTGSVSRLIRDHCRAEVIGIEPSEERAAVARNRGLTVHTSAFPTDKVPAEGSFDVVLFADVLEHLVDPGAALAAAAGYLKPTGAVLVSVPNVAHWTVRRDIIRGNFEYRPCGIMDATHLRWFTHDSVRRLFTSAGYVIESHRMSTGYTLEEYLLTRPWRWLGGRTRNRIIRKMVALWPRGFGCQHVIRAVRSGRST